MFIYALLILLIPVAVVVGLICFIGGILAAFVGVINALFGREEKGKGNSS